MVTSLTPHIADKVGEDKGSKGSWDKDSDGDKGRYSRGVPSKGVFLSILPGCL